MSFRVPNLLSPTKCLIQNANCTTKAITLNHDKPVIEKEDMKKLGNYFKNYYQNPVILTETVWFLLCYYFGRRGREGWTEMRKDFFPIKSKDDSEIVECRKTEAIKNIQGGHKHCEQDYRENEMRRRSSSSFQILLIEIE